MSYDVAQDINALLADLGVDVTKSGTTVKGLRDEDDVVGQDESGQELIVRRTSVVIKTGALSLAIDDAITVDGAAVRVRDVQLMEDGKLTRVILART